MTLKLVTSDESEFDDVVREFARIWAQTAIKGPEDGLAAGMTCYELESLAAVLMACGESEGAAAWIDLHRLTDEEGDMHFRGGDSELTGIEEHWTA